MSTTTPASAPAKTNRIGLEKSDYAGGKSTLCAGCGHDSVTNHLINAFFKSGLNPAKVAKLSGIGCSSKTPAYFLSRSHGFNSVHGRMGPVATGVKLANPELTCIGVSGDGDTASIGMGGFVHLLRRNVPMVYIVENNGVYGLTKGQFSATADLGTKSKSGELNPFQTVDLCSLAIEMGCTFVARSFSGDAKQLVPLVEAALHHHGTAFIDVISPCVTFGNHDGSTRSYDAVREHIKALQELDFITPFDEIKVDYQEGDGQAVEMPDGSWIRLKKLDQRDHNIKDATAAMTLLHQARGKGEILTGLFYVNENGKDLAETLKLPKGEPLYAMNADKLKPSRDVLNKIMQDFR